jgi:hypothetical protein
MAVDTLATRHDSRHSGNNVWHVGILATMCGMLAYWQQGMSVGILATRHVSWHTGNKGCQLAYWQQGMSVGILATVVASMASKFEILFLANIIR